MLGSGTRLGPYEVLNPIGAGGMGEVYRARDERLDRDVAVKVLPPDVIEDADRLRRFEREARAAGALNHPNLLAVFDVGRSESGPYIVSELLDGESLRERLNGPGLTVATAVDFAIQITQGLAAAHEKGIVHRDLKPGNVFVTRDGRVKILDFGLAKVVEEASGAADRSHTATAPTAAGVMLGTAGYMSPEQVEGRPADHRSDIFALGAVLYEMLTGRPAFGGSTIERLHAILKDDPEDPSTRRGVTPALAAVVRRCLAKNPEGRFQSARDIAFALQAVGSTTGPSPAWTESRRRIQVATLAGIVVVAALLAYTRWRDHPPSPPARSPITSLAVLPLANLSGDPAQEFFAEGIHEALITDLAKLSGLSRVIARASVVRYRNTDKPLSEIGRELGVDAILTGAVLREGNRVRVTAQLINAATQEHLWAERYERELRDVLSLQGEIVSSIAEATRAKLTATAQARLARARKVDPEAYEAYLKGKYYLSQSTAEGLEKGLAYLHQAVEKDPADPLAYAGLALAYNLIGHDADPQAFQKARAAEEKALELDDSLAEVHESIAMTKLYKEWDWPGAEQAFKRALALNPNLPEAHSHYGWYLTLMNHLDEGLAEQKRAVAVSPMAPVYRAWLASHYSMAGQHDAAIAEVLKALELAPRFHWAFHILGNVYADVGKYDDAIAAHEKMAALNRNGKWALAQTYARAGRKEEARRLARQVEKDLPDKGTVGLAQLYSLLGEKDEAFRWLERAFQIRDAWLPWAIRGAWGRDTVNLRGDPRFDDLLRRVNLPR